MALVQMPIPIMIETEEDAIELLDLLLKKKIPLGIDTETTGKNIAFDSVVLWSLADEEKRYCLTRYVLPFFRPLLEDPERIWIGTNTRFDGHMLANSGIDLRGDLWDTLTMDWLLDEERRANRHGLKETCEDHLGMNMLPFNEVFPKQRKKRGQPEDTTIDRIYRVLVNDPDAAADYASGDAWGSRALVFGAEGWDGYIPALDEIEIASNYTSWNWYLEREVPFARTLFNMEHRGMLIWPGYLRTLEAPMVEDMDRLQADFAQEVGHAIKLSSPDQVADFFINHLDAPIVKMTSGGKSGNKKPSTDKDVIAEWAASDDEHIRFWVQKLKEFRGVSKIYGTYVKGLLNAHDENFRIHTSFGRPVTGRLSSREPNLQNIPNPAKDKFGIRQAFIAPPGRKLIVGDYAQLEMRILAHYSGDQKMINAILDGLDMHSFTASMMLGVAYEEIIAAKKKNKEDLTEHDKELLLCRTIAKTIGFGIVYGEQAKGLSGQLGIPVREAEQKRRAYLGTYPGVNRWMDETIEECRRVKYVRTLMGRYRRLPAIAYRDYGLRSGAERQAVNSRIQGSAADIAMEAMLMCEFDGRLKQLDCDMILQVHDELVFEVPEENADEALPIIQSNMENVFEEPLSVPLPVDLHIVDDWGEAK